MKRACLLCLLAFAASAQELRVERLHAVEEAGSPLGAYRLVFSVSEPLPAPSGRGIPPRFSLDGQPLELPGDPGERTLLFAYCDILPRGRVMLRVGDPFVPIGEHPGIAVAPLDMLAGAPQRGYEAPHIQRSVGEMVDVLAAFQVEAPSVGMLVRCEAAGEAQFRLFFQLEQEADAAPRELLSSLPVSALELGARYLVFAGGEAQLDAAMRIWWPEKDGLLDFVSALASQPEGAPLLEQPAVQNLLLKSLSSPVAELRYTAARALTELPRAREGLRGVSVRDLLEREPAPVVQRALKELMSALERGE